MSQIENYYTIRLPSVPSPEDNTEWHGEPLSKETPDPYAVLTRGNFKTISEAIAWAREKLNGCPYQIMLVTADGWFDALAPTAPGADLIPPIGGTRDAEKPMTAAEWTVLKLTIERAIDRAMSPEIGAQLRALAEKCGVRWLAACEGRVMP